MLKIQKNSRQVPSVTEYIGNKKYSDLLYGYLQHISKREEDSANRYIEKKDINYSSIAKEIGMSRQTVSSKFKALIEMGLISYNEETQVYELFALDKALATLLPAQTIRVLCNTLRERSISILCYLLKLYVREGESPCILNLDMIKTFLGLSEKNNGVNNQTILDTLYILSELKLIEVHCEECGTRLVYVLDKVNNEVKLDKKFEKKKVSKRGVA
jgi:DNA-binding transcriptional ArsR family regulator